VTGDDFDLAPETLGSVTSAAPWWFVASVRSMRRWQAQWRCSRRSENAPPRPHRAAPAPHRQRVRNHPRLGSNGRRELVALSFQLANLSILGAPTRLGGITRETESHPGAQVAAEQALRLGAQELRPAGADPPRRRAQARGA
jgi:hypothetical protein